MDSFGILTLGFYDFFGSLNSFKLFLSVSSAILCCVVAGIQPQDNQYSKG